MTEDVEDDRESVVDLGVRGDVVVPADAAQLESPLRIAVVPPSRPAVEPPWRYLPRVPKLGPRQVQVEVLRRADPDAVLRHGLREPGTTDRDQRHGLGRRLLRASRLRRPIDQLFHQLATRSLQTSEPLPLHRERRSVDEMQPNRLGNRELQGRHRHFPSDNQCRRIAKCPRGSSDRNVVDVANIALLENQALMGHDAGVARTAMTRRRDLDDLESTRESRQRKGGAMRPNALSLQTAGPTSSEQRLAPVRSVRCNPIDRFIHANQ